MRRCAICDYAEGFGSDAYGIPADNRRVLWKEDHCEYQCSVCAETIKSANFEKEMQDALKTMEPADDTPFDEDCGVPPALSKLPF